MADLILSTIPLRPCVKCGSTVRHDRGDCKACAKAYRVANVERIKARSAAWHAANPERAKANHVAWSAANSEKVNATSAAWYAANPERAKARAAARYSANPERLNAVSGAWKVANPAALRLMDQNRRARKLENGGKLSSGLTAKLFNLQRGKCPCCAQPLGEDYHLDHKMPLALGGSNTDDNMQLLRAKCNLQKHAKHPVDFMQQKGFLL